MPLTLEQLQDLQAEAMADDVDIDLEKMSLWTEAGAREYFESGGEVEPPAPVASFTAAFTSGSRATSATPWLSCLEKRPDAPARAVIFSWTGNRGGQGSAHNVRRVPISWAKELPGFELYEVALPGRGTRMKDELRKSTPALVAELAAALGEALAGGRPYAFVGFSFGAVLAWEVAQAIASSSAGEGPALLCAVSAEGPQWSGRAGKLHSSSESEFRSVLERKGGTDFILKDAGMSKMYLPVIRADLTLEETYAPSSRVAAVPTLAFIGSKAGRDKEKTLIKPADAELWLAATSAAGSRLISLECDWYVMQEEAGAKAVIAELDAFMSKL